MSSTYPPSYRQKPRKCKYSSFEVYLYMYFQTVLTGLYSLIYLLKVSPVALSLLPSDSSREKPEELHTNQFASEVLYRFLSQTSFSSVAVSVFAHFFTFFTVREAELITILSLSLNCTSHTTAPNDTFFAD